MKNAKGIFILAVAAVALFFVGDYILERQTQSKAVAAERAAERRAARLAEMGSRQLQATTFDHEGGKLTVFEIPVSSSLSSTLPETMRCVLWRDASGTSTSLSCENQAQIDLRR